MSSLLPRLMILCSTLSTIRQIGCMIRRMEHSMETLRDRIRIVNGCWEWQRARNKAGYGNVVHNGRTWLSHRLPYMFATGQNPGELLVCHRCDNPPCINPDHLYLGTYKDNASDMHNRGRNWQAVIENCPRSHPLADFNLVPSHLKRGGRSCWACHKANSLAYTHKLRHGICYTEEQLIIISGEYFSKLESNWTTTVDK